MEFYPNMMSNILRKNAQNNTPITAGILEEYMRAESKAREQAYEITFAELRAEITKMKAQIEEITDMLLEEQNRIPMKSKIKTPTKTKIGKRKFKNPDDMDIDEKERTKEQIYEEYYSMFRLTYPGQNVSIKTFPMLKRYAYQSIGGRFWEGLIPFWRDYEHWVMNNKNHLEFEGAIRRPQYKMPQERGENNARGFE